MKNVFALIFWLMFEIIPAVGQTISFGINMPGSHIRVANNTNNNAKIKIVIDGKMARGNFARGSIADRFFPMGTNREIPIEVYGCATTPVVHPIDYPPDWTMNPELGGVAFTEQEVKSIHKTSDLDKKVNALKKTRRGELSQKEDERQLNDWVKRVKSQGGIQYEGTGCDDMQMINAKTSVPLDFSGYTRTIMLIVTGPNADGKYVISPPQYVNN